MDDIKQSVVNFFSRLFSDDRDFIHCSALHFYLPQVSCDYNDFDLMRFFLFGV